MTATKALVVLSGGQDSTTCAAWAVQAFGVENVSALTFNYNQRHSLELRAAKAVALLLGITNHEVLSLGPILNGTSPLTDRTQELETYSDFDSMDKTIGNRVEKTFVPMRNALFLTLAANRAACVGATRIITGVCQADNANYPDCRLDYINAQGWAINYALGRTTPERTYADDRVFIETPLMNMSKAQSIKWMQRLGQLPLLAFTHTAYDGTFPPVSKDHASVLRAHGFEEAGIPDPLVVRAHMAGLMELPLTDNYTLLGDLEEQIAALLHRLPAKWVQAMQEGVHGV